MTLTIAILSRAGTGIENAVRNNYTPLGDHVLIPPDATPGYEDANGNPYHFIQSRDDRDINGNTIQEALSGLENTPHVLLFVAQEQVHVDDINGRRVIWQVGDQALVEVTPRSEILDGFTPIEQEFSTLESDAVNVNTATKQELQGLSGVGGATAQRIIDGRPYASVDELTAISGITQTAVDGWEITV